MDLRQLRFLTRVVSIGSFSRAAAKIGITQPALSRQIRAVEKELGVNLLYRNGRGVVPTPEGERFINSLRPILDELEGICDEIRGARRVPRGNLSIAMPPPACALLAGGLLRHVRETMPEVSLQIVEGYIGTVEDWLNIGELDVAILSSAPRSAPLLRTERLFDAGLFIIHRPDEPDIVARLDASGELDLQKLADLPIFMPSQQSGLRCTIDSAAVRLGFRLEHVTDIGSTTAATHCVMAGLGYTISTLPPFSLMISSGRLVATRITNPYLSQRFSLITSGERPLSAAANLAIRFIRDEIGRCSTSGNLLGIDQDSRA